MKLRDSLLEEKFMSTESNLRMYLSRAFVWVFFGLALVATAAVAVDLFALAQEDALQSNVRLDRHRIVIDEIAFADGPFVFIASHGLHGFLNPCNPRNPWLIQT